MPDFLIHTAILAGIWVTSIFAVYYFLPDPYTWIAGIIITMALTGGGLNDLRRRKKSSLTRKEWEEQWKNRDTSNLE